MATTLLCRLLSNKPMAALDRAACSHATLSPFLSGQISDSVFICFNQGKHQWTKTMGFVPIGQLQGHIGLDRSFLITLPRTQATWAAIFDGKVIVDGNLI